MHKHYKVLQGKKCAPAKSEHRRQKGGGVCARTKPTTDGFPDTSSRSASLLTLNEDLPPAGCLFWGFQIFTLNPPKAQ